MTNIIKIKQADIWTLDYQIYGNLFDLRDSAHCLTPQNVNHWVGEDWIDHNTDMPIIDQLPFLGHVTTDAPPYCIRTLERHHHTQEVIIPISEPLVLLLSASEKIQPEQLLAVKLYPSMAFSINRGVWHSPAYGLSDNVSYFYLAQVIENEPTEWISLEYGICIE